VAAVNPLGRDSVLGLKDIVRLVEDSALRRTLGAHGRALIESRYELAAVVDDLRGTPVLLVDTDEVEAQLEAIPWVESARVTTRFPDSASIEIRERTPVVSMLGEDSRSRVLDADGRVLAVIDGQRMGFSRFAMYMLLFYCRATGGELRRHPLETLDVGWFPRDRIPEHTAGVQWWGPAAFAAIDGAPHATSFDLPRDPVWRGD